MDVFIEFGICLELSANEDESALLFMYAFFHF